MEDYSNEDYYGYVYITLDQKHNKIYIGQKKARIEKTTDYFGSGTRIKNIIKSRGTYFLKKTILGVCYSKEELEFWETECKFFFNAFDKRYGYNILVKDSGGDTFTNQSKEDQDKRRANISKSKKGCVPWNKGLSALTYLSEEALANISRANTGRICTDETRQKMSVSRKGKKKTIEHRKNLSKALKNNPKLKNKEYNPERYRKATETKMRRGTSGKGKIVSEVTRDKLRVANGGENHPMWGKKQSEQTIKKRSESLMGHPAWNKDDKEYGKKMSILNKGEGNGRYKNIDMESFISDIMYYIDNKIKLPKEELAFKYNCSWGTLRKKLKVYNITVYKLVCPRKERVPL